ncbi:legumin B precursor [Dorcoceras hygrometricum]|uniref:Legumin B n=1 Tax=Dorcoceras hygrometricum TaxID=472368 RepID=A0A2Z7B4I9_9LAMI|nr:legumin B precursor [Dorcoceras hygrometricum]
MDLIGVIYRNLPRRAGVIVIPVGARHKCQQEIVLPVKIRRHTFTAHLVNQIKRNYVSSLTYESFPRGHPSHYCSHPCRLNSTLGCSYASELVSFPISFRVGFISNQPFELVSFPVPILNQNTRALLYSELIQLRSILD